ncbi:MULTISPECIES: keywimysin-related RiPP [unclassified Microbacterium]|nr:lasso RiPP family leader peptide-containing protein [Microbacterium sp. ISL-108]RKN69300.1 lasso RiPP family leader peptide-containing protein [Microbacterium sp. CGR2]
MNQYQAPALTKVGSFRKMTRSLGQQRCLDIFQARSLWSLDPNCW